MRLTKHSNSSSQLEAAARLSTTLRRFNLATDLRYRRQFASGLSPPGQLEVSFIGSGGIGNVRLRGSSTMEVGSGGALPCGGAQRLLVRKRTRRLGRRHRLRGGREARSRADLARPANRHDGAVRHRRGCHRRLGRGWIQPEFLTRPRGRIEPVASTACGCGRSASAGLSRSQRQWCPRSDGALRKGGPRHDRHSGCQRSRPTTGEWCWSEGSRHSRLWRSESTQAASTIPIWCPRRRSRSSFHALACLQRWKSAWSAAARSKAPW